VTREVVLERDVVAVEVARGRGYPASRWLKVAGVGLLVYAALGLAMAAVLLAVALTVVPRIQSLNRQMVGSLHATSATLTAAATSVGGAQRSLDQARGVTDTAAQTATDAAANLRQLAAALNFQVFGSQPFGELAPRFAATADNLQRVGAALTSTSQALQRNSSDTGTVQATLSTVPRQLDGLADQLDAGLSGLLVPLELVLAGAWLLLVLHSLLALAAGIALLRV
jgi:hypothetical protein